MGVGDSHYLVQAASGNRLREQNTTFFTRYMYITFLIRLEMSKIRADCHSSYGIYMKRRNTNAKK